MNTNKTIQMNDVGSDQKLRDRTESLASGESLKGAILESSLDSIISLDQNGIISDLNSAAEKTFGFARSELLGQEMRVALFPASARAEFALSLKAALDPSASSGHLEIVALRKDGREFPAEFAISRVAQSESPAFSCFLRDITQRKHVEEKLKLQAAALETAANAVIIADNSGSILWANPAFTALTGYTFQDAVGKTPRILKSGRHNKAFYAELWRTICSKETWRGEFSNRRKDGTIYHGEQTITPVCSPSGEITHFIGIMNDVTARRKVEEDLRVTHEKLRHLLAHSPAVIYALRIEGQRFVPHLISENMTELLGFTVAETLSHDWYVAQLHPEDRERVLAGELETMRSGSNRLEYRLRHKDGSYRWVEDNQRLVRDRAGNPAEITGIWTDITERKALEAEVASREATLKSFFRGATAGLAILDANLRFVQVNETLAEMNGVPLDQHIGRTVSEVLPLLGASLALLLQRVLGTGGSLLNVDISGEVPGAPGIQRHWVESFFPITGIDGAIEGVGAIVVEITERKRAEEALRRSEERYRDLFENAHDLIQSVALDGRLLYVNHAWTEALGYSDEEIDTLKIEDVLAPEHQADYEKLFAKALAGEPLPVLQTEFISKDKKRIAVEGSVSARSVNGQVLSLRCIFRNVTEKKKLEAQFLRTQRMESIGTLAGGIAHDLNNALAPILMSIELLRMNVGDKESQTLLDTIATSAQRGADMVRQVLTFSRGVEGKKMEVQLHHIVREIASMVRQTFPKAINLRTDVAKDLLPVMGDATQLHQVLINLCVNARDAMPHGGTLKVAASNIILDEYFASMNPDARPGSYISLSVSDNGTGMPPEVRERIFDPFFTTKPLDKGTGLGLSTVLGIVQSHGGFISVYTELGKGTEFKIYLPAQSAGTAPAEERQSESFPRGNGELILVVDDEASIRTMTQQTLEKFGYKVLTASDGAQAVAACAQRIGKIDVMLTDLAMPVMDGTAAIHAIRTLDPRMRIIASTGLDSDFKNSDLKRAGANAFLHKPFTAERLLQVLSTVLAAK